MAEASSNNQIVSYENEPLILVNDQDEGVGFLDKAACHDGEGLLHRAFSLFLFNTKGEVLLQQRVANKRLWPMFWSNSCCSHPRQNETMEMAVERRMQEELGIHADMQYLYKFKYHASYLDQGSESELCSVFIGRAVQALNINTHEINDWQWLSMKSLDQQLKNQPEKFTPWLKLEWHTLRSQFSQELNNIVSD